MAITPTLPPGAGANLAGLGLSGGQSAADYYSSAFRVTPRRNPGMGTRTTASTKKPTNPYGAIDPLTALAQAKGLYGLPIGNKAMSTLASNQVWGAINPAIAKINASYTDQAKAGAAAIQGVTDQYVKNLQPYAGQIEGGYDAAAQKLANLNDALGSAVNGGSTSNFGSALSSLGIGGDFAGKFNSLVGNAGNTEQALGVSNIAPLITSGAGYGAYAKLLPAFAQEQGIQQIGAFTGGLAQQQTGKVNDLLATVPGLISSALQNYQSISEGRRKNIGDYVSNAQSGLVSANEAAAALQQQYDQTASSVNQDVYDQGQANYRAGLNGNGGNAYGTLPTGQHYAQLLQDLHGIAFSGRPTLAQQARGAKTAALPYASALSQMSSYVEHAFGLAPKSAQQFAASQLRQWGITATSAKTTSTSVSPPKNNVGDPPGTTYHVDPATGNMVRVVPKAPGPKPIGSRQTSQPPQPKGHPNSHYMANGPKGPGWYDVHPTGRQAPIYIKVG